MNITRIKKEFENFNFEYIYNNYSESKLSTCEEIKYVAYSAYYLNRTGSAVKIIEKNFDNIRNKDKVELLILSAFFNTIIYNNKTALNIIKKIKNDTDFKNKPDLYAKFLICEAYTQSLSFNQKSALTIIKKVIKLLEQKNDNISAGLLNTAYRISGIIYMRLVDFKNTVKYCKKVISRCR